MSFENAEQLLSKDSQNNARILTQMMRNTNNVSIYKQIYNKLMEENYPERLVVEAINSARYANEERGTACTLQETEGVVRYILNILSDNTAKENFVKQKMEG